MIRVGAVIDTFDVGGFELACLDLLKRLDSSRFSSHIYTFRPGALVERARAAGIPVLIGHNKPPEDLEWRPQDIRAREAWTGTLAAAMAAQHADLCLVWAWPEAIVAAQQAGVGAIVERIDGPGLAGRVGNKSALDLVICESDMARQMLIAQRDLLGLDPSRVEVIRNGVDLSRFYPGVVSRAAARSSLGLPANAFIVGTIARLAPEKNLVQLVRGFAAALSGHGRWLASQGWLVLCGPDAGSRAELEAEVQSAGIADRVLFTGARDDTPTVLAALDVFCTTSYTEGTPAAVLEAMAMGKAIVATPVGGLLEMLDGNAILVDLLAPRATSEAIARLAADTELREQLGRRSAALAQGWTIESHVERYESALEKVWQKSRVPGG